MRSSFREFDAIRLAMSWTSRLRALERDRETQDRGERGAEVVRDRLQERVLHLVERAEPLRSIPLTDQGIVQLLLRALQLRDVDVDALPELRSAELVTEEGGVLPHPYGPAVAGDHAVLDAERRPVFERADGARLRGGEVVRVGDTGPEVGVAHPFLRSVAEQTLDLRADVDGDEV
jgi:hypothetical protein